MIEVLPAPVGPVIANRSSLEKSILTLSQKLVNPSSSRLIGRIYRLLVELVEQLCDLLGWFTPALVRIVATEQLEWISAGNRGRRRFEPRIIQLYLERVGQDFVHETGDAGDRFVDGKSDSQEIVSKRSRVQLQLVERAADVSQPPSRCQRDALDVRRFFRLCVDDYVTFFLVLFSEVELKNRAGIERAGGRRKLLRPVQVAQSDVLRGRRESLCGHGVWLRNVNLTFTPGSLRSIDIEVRHHQVDCLNREVRRQCGKHCSDALGVFLIALNLGAHEPGRLFDPPDCDEREHCYACQLSVLLKSHYAAVFGSRRFGTDVNVEQAEQVAQGSEASGMVVITANDHCGDAGLFELGEKIEGKTFGIGWRRV